MIWYIKNKIMTCLFYLMRVFPIKKNKIVVCSYLGHGFGDNGKYIIEQLLKQDGKYDIVWLTRNMEDQFPLGIRSVKYNTIKSVYEQVTAKVWIDNRRKPGYVRKRKQQYYIQTWHGGVCIKKIEKDAVDALSKHYIEAAKNDSKMADLFLSNSQWTTNLYRNAFWYDGEIEKNGLPREEILFQNNQEKKAEIKKRLGIKQDTKVVLYAPTFRKKKDTQSLKLYNLPWKNIIECLQSRFGGNWISVIRLHPNLYKIKDSLSLPHNTVDATSYPDMQELLLIADCLISDYSSCVFDFAVSMKPVFLYIPDYSDYMEDRGSYFDIFTLPFPARTEMGELLKEILRFNEESYSQKLMIFMENCGYYKGGNTSALIARRIKKLVEE